MSQKTLVLFALSFLGFTGTLGLLLGRPGLIEMSWTAIVGVYALGAMVIYLRRKYRREKDLENDTRAIFRLSPTATRTYVVQYSIWLVAVIMLIAPAARVVFHRLWAGPGHFLCGHAPIFWWR